jgi:outer membrane murein-binding lipoprotein Lpp
MRLLRRTLFAVCASLLLAGCPDKQAASMDGGLAEAPQDAGPAVPPPAAFTIRYQPGDGGLEPIPLAVEERPTIEPTSLLELHSSIGLRNYRIRLFDEIERAMVSDDSAEENPNGVIYRISLPTPLKSGHKYTLVLDAQTGTAFTDALGREVDELRFQFQVAGEKEKDAPPPPKKNEKKKRR